jgi:ferredoxin-thioredoxin reductase catalytic chain
MEQRTRAELETIAETNGWKVNPNQNAVNGLLISQNNAKQRLGEYYCPCKIQRTPANICPCADAAREIAENGRCHCNLFVKDEKSAPIRIGD